jgi:hypothetical protein
MTPRRILPGPCREERLVLLLQLPVPAAAAPPRHHRAVCLLPRDRRRGRRMHRRRSGAHPARLVAHADRRLLRRHAGASGLPRPAAGDTRLRPAARTAAGNHRRHGNGPRSVALPRLQGSAALLLPRRVGGRAAGGADLRRHAARNAEVRTRSGHRLPADQHHPRRRRRRAARPHLPAGVGTAAIQRACRRHPQRTLQRRIPPVDGIPDQSRAAVLRTGDGRPAPGRSRRRSAPDW